jgi:uncharacterized protein (DUF952 family)
MTKARNSQMNLTYHLVPKAYYEAQDKSTEYVPEQYLRDGFIHCTDGAEEMARVANAYYKGEPPPHLYLYIDKERVRAPIMYVDAGHKYPHIYGSLNYDAITAICEARRDEEGNFLPPDAV